MEGVFECVLFCFDFVTEISKGSVDPSTTGPSTSPPPGGGRGFILLTPHNLFLVLLSSPGRGMFKTLHTLRQEPARATMAQETAGEVKTRAVAVSIAAVSV